MNYKMVGRVLGMVLLCLAGLMLVPLLAGIIYETFAIVDE